MRHCATIQKVVGLIPYSVNGIFIDIILPAGSGINSASNRIEYQEYFLWGKGGRCVGLTTLPPSCADCLEIWNPQGLSRSVMGLLYRYLYLFTYCTHPRISNGPALGRMGLYSIRVCKHPVTSHVPLPCRANTTVTRCSTAFPICRQCNHLVLLCLSFTAYSCCCVGLIVQSYSASPYKEVGLPTGCEAFCVYHKWD